jgi:hypothetical protein
MSDDDLRVNNSDRDKNNDNDRQHHQGSCQSLDGDALDRELDAALAKYAAVEPRPGLEERVLANLSAERKQASAHSWLRWGVVAAVAAVWRWGVVAAVAAVLLVTSTLLWRSGESREHLRLQALSSNQDNAAGATRVTTNGEIDQTPLLHPTLSRKQAARIRRRPATVVTASGPRLDQFPSPEPLSKQERILQRYVAKYPEHAALIAQARAEALRQDLAEEMKISAPSRDSKQ